MMGGRELGLLFLVLRWSVRGFAWSVAGAVRLVVVVIGVDAPTLCIFASPYEVEDWSTL